MPIECACTCISTKKFNKEIKLKTYFCCYVAYIHTLYVYVSVFLKLLMGSLIKLINIICFT